MIREMRRKRQLLPERETEEILMRGTSGVLALIGDEGYPYAVPLSYVYEKGKFFFHCARQGHKLDALRRCGRASFCVIDRDQIVPEEYTTYFRSVIVFGTVREVTEDEEKRAAMERLARKYAPEDTEEHRRKAIEDEWKPLCVLEMNVEHMTGKEAIELRRKSEYGK